jgi:hypothetical protein
MTKVRLIALVAVTALILVACSQPAREAPAPRAAEPVEVVAARFGRAAFGGDREAALALSVSFADIAAVTTSAADKGQPAWDEAVADFIERAAREGKEGPAFEVVGAKVLETRTLTPATDGKVLRDVEIAVVQLLVEEDGKPSGPQGIPLVFLRTAGGWRFSPMN